MRGMGTYATWASWACCKVVHVIAAGYHIWALDASFFHRIIRLESKFRERKATLNNSTVATHCNCLFIYAATSVFGRMFSRVP